MNLEKGKHKFEVGKIGNRYAKVKKTAGNTFSSLKEYEKTASTMLKIKICHCRLKQMR